MNVYWHLKSMYQGNIPSNESLAVSVLSAEINTQVYIKSMSSLYQRYVFNFQP